MSKKKTLLTISLFLLICAQMLSGCSYTATQEESATSNPESSESNTPVATATTSVPTPTSLPMIAIINGEGILLSDFNEELARIQDSQAQQNGKTLEELQQIVLNDLIDNVLLAQAAEEAGFVVDENTLQTHLDDLATSLGGMNELVTWIIDNHYTDESFQRALKRSITAAWQREQITANIPASEEQVLLQQIMVLDPGTADNIYQQLLAGVEFDTLAYQYDTVTSGYLGWVPKDYLQHPEIGEAAFALQPGEFSQIIETDIGYHIIQAIERDTDHPLSADAIQLRKQQAVQNWLQQKRQQSEINIIS